MISALHTAWAAGLFEGEGSISIIEPKTQVQTAKVALTLSMTDPDSVAKFCAVAGAGQIYEYKRPPGRKRLWMWKLQDTRQSCDLLRRMLPWLGNRRTEKARRAIEVEEARWRTCYCGRHFYANYGNKRYCHPLCAERMRSTQIGSVA